MTEALELVEPKRDADGRWPLDYTYPGEVHFDIGRGRGQAQPLEHAPRAARAALGGRGAADRADGAAGATA